MAIKPTYYKAGAFDVIDFCHLFKLPFTLGNVVKYVVRAGKKEDAIEDLKKAKEYIEREIAFLEKHNEGLGNLF